MCATWRWAAPRRRRGREPVFVFVGAVWRGASRGRCVAAPLPAPRLFCCGVRERLGNVSAGCCVRCGAAITETRYLGCVWNVNVKGLRKGTDALKQFAAGCRRAGAVVRRLESKQTACFGRHVDEVLWRVVVRPRLNVDGVHSLYGELG